MEQIVKTTLDIANRTVALDGAVPDSPTFRVEEGDTLRWTVNHPPGGGSRMRVEFVGFPNADDPVPLLIDATLEAGPGETLGGCVNPAAPGGVYEYTLSLVSGDESPVALRVLHTDGSMAPKVSGIKDPRVP